MIVIFFNKFLTSKYKLLKEGGWILIGQLTNVIASLILVRILTDFLNPTTYGELALGLTISGLVNQVIMGGVSGGIGRYYSIALEKNDLFGYIKDSILLSSYTSIVLLFTGSVTVLVLFMLNNVKWAILSLVAIGFSLVSSYNSTMTGIQNSARQRATAAILGTTESIFRIVCIITIFKIFVNSSTNAVLGYTASAIILLTLQSFFLHKLLKKKINPEASVEKFDWKKVIWQYSWPFSTWGIFTWLQQASDKWSLAILGSPDEVGGYAVLFQLGFAPISMGVGLLTNLIAPIMYQKAGDARDTNRITEVYHVTKIIALLVGSIVFIVFVITAIFHAHIFRLFVNIRYIKYSFLMPYMILAGGLQACHHIFGIRISASLKVKSIVIPQIISAIAFISLNTLGTYIGGIKGLVIGFLLASFGYFLWMLILSEVFFNKSKQSES